MQEHLIQILSEGGGIIIHIIHQHSEVGLALMFGVRRADGQRVPRPLLVVQRAGQRHSSPVTVDSKHASAARVQV